MTISQLDPYIPSSSNPITVEIYNIVNPNRLSRALTNSIKIGTMRQYTNHFIDFNSQAATPEITTAPGWSYLYNITSTNLYSRIKANYTFNFSLTNSLPKVSSNGFVFVDLPSQFEIADPKLNAPAQQLVLWANLTAGLLGIEFIFKEMKTTIREISFLKLT